jgi:hypothetical protein
MLVFRRQDLILLAPSSAAMRSMLLACDDFANDLYDSCNAAKSKCFISLRDIGELLLAGWSPCFMLKM